MSDALKRIVDRCSRTFSLRAVATIMFRSFQSMMIHLFVGMDAMRSGGFAGDFWWLFAPYPILLFVVFCAKKCFGARRVAARTPRAGK